MVHSESQVREVITPVGAVRFYLHRSVRRTIEVQVTRMGEVHVRSPRCLAEAAVNTFIQKKARWIVTKVTHFRKTSQAFCERAYEPGSRILFLGEPCEIVLSDARPENPSIRFDGTRWELTNPDGLDKEACRAHVKALLSGWLQEQAQELLGARVFHLARIMGEVPGQVVLKNHKRLWGSCNARRRTINLNWQIIMAPQDVIDYVVIHELAHLQVQNHSALFWRRVAQFDPGYKDRHLWLKRHAGEMFLP